VSGWVSTYYGIPEIISGGAGNCIFRVDTVGHAPAPTPQVITSQAAFESVEGALVRVNNVSIVSGTWPAVGDTGRITVSDANGTLYLFLLPSTNIDGSPQPQGAFDVVGIMSQYDRTLPYTDYYEIIPRSTSDIIALGAEDPHAAAMTREFSLSGAYPNPFNGATQIRYEVGTARELTLSIFDLLGREITSQKLTNLTPGTHTFTWNPACASGGYLVRMQGATGPQMAKLLYLK
jgi:hypothetical protein